MDGLREEVELWQAQQKDRRAMLDWVRCPRQNSCQPPLYVLAVQCAPPKLGEIELVI